MEFQLIILLDEVMKNKEKRVPIRNSFLVFIYLLSIAVTSSEIFVASPFL